MTDPLQIVIDIVVREINPDSIIPFCSRATCTAHGESDYDLCALKSGVTHRRKLAMRIYRQLYGIGVAVEVLVGSPERFKELKSNPFLVYHEIAAHGRVLCERPVSS